MIKGEWNEPQIRAFMNIQHSSDTLFESNQKKLLKPHVLKGLE